MDLHGRSLLKETDLNAEEFLYLVELARRLREDKRQGVTGRRLAEYLVGGVLKADLRPLRAKSLKWDMLSCPSRTR